MIFSAGKAHNLAVNAVSQVMTKSACHSGRNKCDADSKIQGEAVDIYEGEIPVFWPCGVTPQAAIENAKPPIVITHAPGHMFITDIPNAELNDYLEAKKK